MNNVNEKVHNMLCEVYTAEIGAIGIYMDQHTKCEDLGLKKLAEILENDAKDEMKHAEMLAERILFLGATVKNQKHALPEEKQFDVVEMLQLNADIEMKAIARLNEGITICFDEKDHGSRMLLEEILKSEEEHLTNLQTMVNNIKKYGDPYVVSQLM
ncbi:MAG: bacterioferritin [Candidatus Kuenenia sp.]|nr:bacterioferritin [Candidatus Kuenenia hertensis]